MTDAQFTVMEVGPAWAGMSGRESVGDLIPQDVAEVFAHERHTKGGRRKKRGGSLSRAFSWLKGKRKKDVNANGQSQDFHSGGMKAGKLTPAGHHHAVLKQEDEGGHSPSHYQENVFIEASRPKYLEDLHTEAQEGLKMQLQEETNFGVDYQDNQSVASTVTRQPNDTETETEMESYSYRDRRGSMSDSTMADTMSQVSTRSTISTRSTRSGLTRQASTFRPLKSEKKPEKAKARRKHRRTVMGIPQHIQRELGLDRAAWAGRQVIDEDRPPNSESQNSHTIDGPDQARSREGVRYYLQSVEGLQPVRDDLALLQPTDPQLAEVNRPKSLAVPWMTTASSLQQQPPSPVMSMNPQAAYMSKIIPNAVLPPSIDVVEISCDRSRSSVRTITKSKLLLASPASSRASSRASTMSSASRYNPPHFSDSSGWSRSDSSETLVSDSSTISSNSTARPEGSQEGEGSVKGRALDGVSIHSSVSKASRISAANLKGKARGNDGKQEGPFVRSLSVMKPKRAPPPPSRSYSLHKDKMKRRSRDLTEPFRISTPHQSSPALGSVAKSGSAAKAGSSPMPASNTSSPGYTADTSSPDDSPHSVTISPLNTLQQTAWEGGRNEQPGSKHSSPQTTQENGLKKTVSPSSHGGTPSLSSKQTQNPGNRRGILAKLANIFPRATSPAALSTSKKPEPQSLSPSVTPSPSVMALRELFNIPPPPKVSAPPPPPPEVWAHNTRTFELLLGPPAPNNMDTVVRKNPKDRRQQRQCPSREGSVRNVSTEQEVGSGLDRISLAKEQLGPVDQEKEQFNSVSVVKQDCVKGLAQIEPSGGVKWNSEVAQKVESESMMMSQLIGKLEKDKASQLGNGKSGKAVIAHGKGPESVNTDMHSHTTESQATMATLSMVSHALAQVTQSPSPPPSHFPPLPPSKQTLLVDPHLMPPDSMVSPEHRLVSPYGEAFWPPPPSPMDLTTLGSELDLPLPPPPSGYEDEVVTTAPVTEQTVKAPKLAHSALQNVPSVSQGIPPPPQTIPPPPPQKAPPAPALEVDCPTSKQTSPTKPNFCPPFSIPPPPQNSPPPPPVNTTRQSKPVTLESQNPDNASLSQSPPTPPEEASTPVVTPSLLQMVKLRSVKHAGQEQAQIEVTEVTLRSKKSSTAEAPQKPIRRSLIMTSPSSTLTFQHAVSSQPSIGSTTETIPAPEEITNLEVTPAPVVIPAPVPVVTPAPAPVVIPAPAPVVIPAPAPVVIPAPAPVVIPAPVPVVIPASAPVMTPAPAPVVTPAPVVIPASAPVMTPAPAPVVTPAPAPMVTPVPVMTPAPALDATPAPATVVTPALNTTPAPAPVMTPAPAPVVTPVLDATPAPAPVVTLVLDATPAPAPVVTPVLDATPAPAPVVTLVLDATPTQASVVTPAPASALEAIPAPEATPAKNQPTKLNLAPTSSVVTSPTCKTPDSGTNNSMRMQEAIRMRTAARSKEGPSSRFSLNSVISPTGLKSPTSTANFIFAKSTKKVVIETPSSPGSQANLTKNLIAELSSKQMPPPVARKPQHKVKDEETGVQTEHVQSAGQEAQPTEGAEGAPEAPNGVPASLST